MLKLVASLNAVAFGGAQVALVASFVWLAERLGLELSNTIACFSLGSFLFLVGSPYWARVSDTNGRIPILALGSSALVVSFGIPVCLLFSPFADPSLNLMALAVSRVIYGLIASSIPPVAQALQADLDPETTRGMLLHSMGLNVGRVLGLIAVLFADLAMLGIFLVAVSVVTVAQLRVESRMMRSREVEEASRISVRDELRSVGPVVLVAAVFAVLVEALNSSLAGNLTAILTLEPDETSSFTARVLLAATVGTIGVQAFTRRYLRWSARMSLFAGVLALTGGATWYASATSSTDIWIAVAGFTLGIGWAAPGYLAVLQEGATRATRGRRAGLISSVHTLGYAFGGAIAAWALGLGVQVSRYALVGLAVVLVAASLKLLPMKLAAEDTA